MFGNVGHRMELHRAHQRTRRLSADGQLVSRERQPPRLISPSTASGIERNQGGLLFGSVDDCRHFACAPCRTRRPLTGSRTRLAAIVTKLA